MSLLYRGMSEKEIDRFHQAGHTLEKTFSDGEIIFSQGEDPRYLYILLDGALKVQNIQPTGRVVTVNRFDEPGTVFGEVYLYLDRVYDYFAISHGKSRVRMISKSWFMEESYDPLRERLKNNMLAILSRKAFFLNQRLQVFSESSIREKVLQDLLQSSQDDEFVLSTTKEDWATRLGIPRPSLSRELSKLQEEGVLTSQRGRVIVNRKKVLEIYEGT